MLMALTLNFSKYSNLRTAKNAIGNEPAGHEPVGNEPVGHDPEGYEPVGHEPEGDDQDKSQEATIQQVTNQ